VNDIKELSAEAIALGVKFYSEVSMNGGREIADEAIRQMKKKATELQRRRGELHKLQSGKGV
jgi:hypothetical protein